MNIIKSLIGRWNGINQDIKSNFWEYTKYFENEPIVENAILFESFGGINFQGNPFYIFMSIFKDDRFKNYILYISSQNKSDLQSYLENRNLYDNRVQIVDYNSFEYRKVLSTSKYLVNNVSFNMDFIKKDEQIYLNTWHGTPLKYLGRRILNDPFEMNNAQRNYLLSDYLIAPNVFTADVYCNDYMVKNIMPGKIYLQGYPRNSVFFDGELREKVREKYKLNGYTSILYMPTWRGTANGVDQIDVFSEMEKLAIILGERYKIFVKLHPAMMDQLVNVDKIQYAPNDCEIYEFCNACDILITDYSSVFFDFSNTGKPIVLYQYDIKTYFRNRGAYSEVQDNLPFQIVNTFEDLVKIIQKIPLIDYSTFRDKFCKYDNKYSADRAKELLFSGYMNDESSIVDLYVIDFPVTDEKILMWADKLKEKNYRFVFLPMRKNGRFSNLSCFDKIEYMVLYTYDRLNVLETIEYKIIDVIYRITGSTSCLKKMKYFCKREQRRLWGNMKIGKIYAKGKKRPTAVRFSENWILE